MPVTDVTMRMLLLLRLVLAAAGALLASADSSSNSIKMTTKERDKVVNNLEANLLSLLGFKKRPKPMKPAYVPESLKQLYARQNTIDTTDIAKPGIHVRSSNTVRTFSHVGKYAIDFYSSSFLSLKNSSDGTLLKHLVLLLSNKNKLLK